MNNSKFLLKTIAFTTACITVTTLSGCGAKALPNFQIPEGGLTTEPITIDFYSTMGQNLQDVFNAYLPEFQEMYPNITVNHTQPGSYDDVRDQVSTELAARGGPDLAYCYPDHVALYNKAGAVVRLDNLIDNSEYGLTKAQVDDFIPGYYEEGVQYGDGAMYTLPFSKSTEVLYYNKTFFEKHDLKVPTSWDEMEAVCRQIKKIDPTSTPLGYDSESNWFITLCEQYGSPYTSATGDHFLFDNEVNRGFVKKIRQWFKDGLVTTQEIYGSYTSGLFVATAEGENKSYMSIGSSAGATHQRPAKGADNTYPFEVGIAPIPQVNQKKAKVISQGPSLCLFKGQNPQETLAAWLLMKFMTTNVAFQAEFSRASGYVPVLQSVGELDSYKAYLDKADGGDNVAFLSAKVCLEQVDNYYTSPAFVGSSKAREEVGNIIVRVLGADLNADDDQIIDEAFRTAIEECEYSI